MVTPADGALFCASLRFCAPRTGASFRRPETGSPLILRPQTAVSPTSLILAAQFVVHQQGYHAALPGVLLKGQAALLPLLPRSGTGGDRDGLVVVGRALTAALRGCVPRQLPCLFFRGLEAAETVEVADRRVGATQLSLGARLLGVDLPQHHQTQNHQPSLGLALLGRREVHADLGRVHDPRAALLRPYRHVGAHGRGGSRDALEGEDLRLRAAWSQLGEGESLVVHRHGDAV